MELLSKLVDSIKYLGVIIDKKLTWFQQVDKVTLKANRVGGFLYRNIKHCSLDIKNRCYKIFSYSTNFGVCMHQSYGLLTMINT